MAISMVGDGCRYCQPQEHIDRFKDWLEDEQNEISRLQAENKALRARVAGLVEALQAISRNELDAQRAQYIAAVALSTHTLESIK